MAATIAAARQPLHRPPLDRRDADPAAEASLGRLLRLMATLRDPVAGCPWDVAQSFATIEADGLPQTMSFEIKDGKVSGIFVIRNPEKLKHVTAEWIREGQT